MSENSNHLEFYWGSAFAGKKGYVMVPPGVTGLMRRAGLKESEVLLIIAINSFRRPSNDELPFPSDGTLADLVGMHRTSINAMVKRLERKGFIKVPVRGKRGRGHTNHYDLSPLFARLAEVAAGDGGAPPPRGMPPAAADPHHDITVAASSRAASTVGVMATLKARCDAIEQQLAMPGIDHATEDRLLGEQIGLDEQIHAMEAADGR